MVRSEQTLKPKEQEKKKCMGNREKRDDFKINMIFAKSCPINRIISRCLSLKRRAQTNAKIEKDSDKYTYKMRNRGRKRGREKEKVHWSKM